MQGTVRYKRSQWQDVAVVGDLGSNGLTVTITWRLVSKSTSTFGPALSLTSNTCNNPTGNYYVWSSYGEDSMSDFRGYFTATTNDDTVLFWEMTEVGGAYDCGVIIAGQWADGIEDIETKVDTVDTVVDSIQIDTDSIETKVDTIDGLIDDLTALTEKSTGGGVQRYTIEELEDIGIVGTGLVAGKTTYIYLYALTKDTASPTLTTVTFSAAGKATCTGVGGGMYIWSSQTTGFCDWVTNHIVDEDFPQAFMWIMKEKNTVVGDIVNPPRDTGMFVVGKKPQMQHIPVYNADEVSQIICIGENLPSGASVDITLCRVGPGGSPSVTLITGMANTSCYETTTGIYSWGSQGTYFWSAQTDAAKITNPNDPTLYAWMMTADTDPLAKQYGYFFVSEQAMTDYSSDFNALMSKLNQLLMEQRKKESPFTYPGKGGR